MSVLGLDGKAIIGTRFSLRYTAGMHEGRTYWPRRQPPALGERWAISANGAREADQHAAAVEVEGDDEAWIAVFEVRAGPPGESGS